ncbi:hypothetical protein AVEN_166711-1 [Araneus ventricosus]|uniref:Histone-lysine N-methyltransferase SETMAR n=1 Tax=Araneus ventricosus TaxID=182803 RepID=A0A4Y2JXY3_ARAVE|nr:hypothetical protein AVEN_166711-1 [Araneus ventricosus]
MLSGGVILLHDNTHTARKTKELLQKFKWEVWIHPPYSLDLSSNLGSKHLSGTRFSSKGDVKTAAENWLNGQDVIVLVLQTGTYYNESQRNFYPGNNLNL